MSPARDIDLKLLDAVKNSDLGKVEALLAAKADPNAEYEQGYTPLHCASSKGLEDIFTKLLAAGANPNAKSQYNVTPLHYASENGHEAIVTKLIAAKADPNAKDDTDITPLHKACLKEHEAVVAKLLAANADPNVRNKWGRAPLHEASENGNEAIITMLLAAKADPNVKNLVEETPLHIACMKGHEVVVTKLLAAGADPHPKIRDRDDSTPLTWARTRCHRGVAAILSDNFVQQVADNIPDPKLSAILCKSPPVFELNILRTLYAEVRKGMGRDQRSVAFPEGLGELIVARLHNDL